METKIVIIGNGNWATTIAKVIAENVLTTDSFNKEVKMFVHEEIYKDTKLSEFINTFNTNPIYLEGVELPKNIIAVTDISIANEADILVICIPHQFIDIIKDIKPKKGAFAINLSKGFVVKDQELLMPSTYIKRVLGIECCCLMGANLACEVAQKKLAECVLGFTKVEQVELLEKMFKNSYFRAKALPYNEGMEVCGGLKNIIALGYGIVKGNEWGSNAESIVFRKGLVEIKNFCELIKADFMVLETFCIGDLLTSCTAGRNFKCGIELGKCKNLVCEIENRMKGQKLQGPDTAKSVCEWLDLVGAKKENFKLFYTIYKICFQGEPASILKSVLEE